MIGNNIRTIKASCKTSKLLLAVIVFGVLSTLITLCSFFSYAAQPFNVAIDLPDTYKETVSGTEIWFTIKLLNLANSQRVDVVLNYEIVGPDNSTSIAHSSKTVAVETQASFVASLTLPSNMKPGDYYVRVTVTSAMGDSQAQTSFKVHNPQGDMLKYYYIGAAVIGLILLIILISIIVSKSRPYREKLQMRLKIRKIVKEKLKE
jgi:hypothetical protein